MLAAMKRAITGLMSWLREEKTAIAEIEAKPEEIYLADLLIRRFDERNAERREWVSRSGKMKAAVKDMQRLADITAYLKEHGILTVADLEVHMEEIRSTALPLKEKIKKAESRITQIGKIHQYAEIYNRTDAVHAQYLKIHWKGMQQKFAAAHKQELDEWNAANRWLRKNLPEFIYRPKALAAEEEVLRAEIKSLEDQLVPMDAEISMMKDIRYYVKDLLPELMPEAGPIKPEYKAEKKSVLDSLHRKQETEQRERRGTQRERQKRKDRGIDI